MHQLKDLSERNEILLAMSGSKHAMLSQGPRHKCKGRNAARDPEIVSA